MRTRKEIENETQVGGINEYLHSRVTVELLLDIRDLLQPETIHVSLTEKEEKEPIEECGCLEPSRAGILLGDYICCTYCGKPRRTPQPEKPELNVEELLDEYAWNTTIISTTKFKENKNACEIRNQEILEIIKSAIK